MSARKAFYWVAFWIITALIFNIGISIFMDRDSAMMFLGGYIIELSLSMDNLFLFILVFTSFRIKSVYQRRVLNYGIAGAMILRLVFILLGVTIINMFHWILYIFGVVLLLSAVKMVFRKEECKDYKESRVLKLLGKFIPVTGRLEGERFFVRKNRVLYATPLFAVLMVIELTDIIFALDSIPAIFSITTDPFIVYTSNIFAILGLRSMYFLLGDLHERFRYVKYGIALILAFTGIKLLTLVFEFHIPVEWSLGVIFTILAVSIAASAGFSRKARVYPVKRTIRK